MTDDGARQLHNKHAKLTKPAWENSIPPLYGLILAGGESRRMGVDKSAMEYHGMPQHEFLYLMISKLVREAYISCHPDRIPATEHGIITDTFLDLGPYSGVLSAFRFNPNVAWLTVACDMPLLNEEVIFQLIKERDPAKTSTCYHNPETDLPEPLLTIWEPRAYPILLNNLSQGISCLRKSLINSDTKQISVSAFEFLKNANTPEEAKIIKEYIRGK